MNKWTPPRNSGGIPLVSTIFSLSMEMSRLTRDGTAEPVSRDQILRHERGQVNILFSYSADHVQDWQPYPVDPYSCYTCDHTDGANLYPPGVFFCFLVYRSDAVLSLLWHYVVCFVFQEKTMHLNFLSIHSPPDLKKYLNTSESSEHPPNRKQGGKCQHL